MSTLLVAFAFIFALFAAIGWPATARVNFGWLALVFYFASILLTSFPAIFRH